MGSTPTASELMTTAGRVLRISAPFVGLKSTSQTSPRFGFGELLFVVLNDVASLDFVAFVEGVLVVLLKLFRLLSHDLATLL